MLLFSRRRFQHQLVNEGRQRQIVSCFKFVLNRVMSFPLGLETFFLHDAISNTVGVQYNSCILTMPLSHISFSQCFSILKIFQYE
uniref:Ovule protein n=1 Tax=Syphacia muris TaxID=451379 RepID=A0A0N5ACQ6_9BILA